MYLNVDQTLMMLLLDSSYDDVAGLFIVAIFVLVILHEWISGEIPGSMFGGWVTRREKDPVRFDRSIRSGIVLIVLLLARVAVRHWLQKSSSGFPAR